MSKRSRKRKSRSFHSQLNDTERLAVDLEKAVQRLQGADKDFADSLLTQWRRFGRWSNKQTYWVRELCKRGQRIRRAEGREVRRSASDDHSVYAIRCGDAVKLGMSKHPEARARDIQTGNARKAEVVWSEVAGPRHAARKAEKRLHDKFRKFRMRGEWFQAEPVLETLLAGGTEDELELVYDAQRAIG